MNTIWRAYEAKFSHAIFENVNFEMHNSKVCGVFEKIEDFSSVKRFYFATKNSIQIARPKYHVTLACDVMLGAKQQANMDDWGK